MLVKACGLTSLQEIHWAQELAYDFIGIVLEPRSHRYVCNPAELWSQLDTQWRKRCVLVAKKWQSLELAAQRFPEALLQCYDGYPSSVEAARRLEPVASEEQYLQSAAAFCLYDVSLGSGKWQGVPAWCRGKEGLFVAGGLNLENLQSLAQESGPFFAGFDLSSGLELNGKKDFAKMQSCIEWIRSAGFEALPYKSVIESDF